MLLKTLLSNVRNQYDGFGVLFIFLYIIDNQKTNKAVRPL